MTMGSAMPNGGCEAVVEALKAEFGAFLAARIIDDEAVDFLWESRVREHYLGQHVSLETDAEELSRIAILGVLAGRIHVAMCLVDGEGRAVDLLWKESFDGLDEAEEGLARAV